MSPFRLLEEVISKLEISEIPYMLTGSIVSSLQGVPRSTHDIDFVISISEKDIEKIINNFSKEDFYYNKETIIDAVNKRSQFNLISQKFGDKIDFWLLMDTDFDRSRFSRKQRIRIMDFDTNVSAPEDTILEKLYWSKLSGGSKKHYLDALSVYELQMEILDIDYLEEWARKLEISSLLNSIKNDIQKNNNQDI